MRPNGIIEYSLLITAIGFFIYTSMYGWGVFEFFAQASLVIIYFLVRCNCRLLEENQPSGD
jgi:hypothetical protein